MFLFKVIPFILFSLCLGTVFSKDFPVWTGNLSYSIEAHLYDSNIVLSLKVTNNENSQHKYRYLSINDLSFNYYSQIKGEKPGYLVARLGSDILSCSETEHNFLGGDYLPSSLYNWQYEYGDDEVDAWGAVLDYGDSDKRIYFQLIVDAKTQNPIVFQSSPEDPNFNPSVSIFAILYLGFTQNDFLDDLYFPPIPGNCTNTVSESGFIPLHITALMDSLQGIFEPGQLALSSSQRNADPEFSSFLYTNRKFYKDKHEYLYRYEIFKRNCKLIKDHNANTYKTYELGITKFTDMEYNDFFAIMYPYTVPRDSNDTINYKLGHEQNFRFSEPAESVNWVEAVKFFPARDQVFCGSSWAFSIVSALEMNWYMRTNEPISFSEQQIIDCSCTDSKYINFYCCGGDRFTEALNRIILENVEFELGDKYPYSGALSSKCRNVGNRTVGMQLINVLPQEKGMMSALSDYGPILASMDSTPKDIIYYKKGIYDNFNCNDSSKEYSHKVLIVGYGKEPVNGEIIPYWLIRNSWGKNWGSDGYMKVARMNHSNIICGFHPDMFFLGFDSN